MGTAWARRALCELALRVTYSDCVTVTLVIQHAMLTHRITLSFVSCPALLYFPHYLITETFHGGTNNKLFDMKRVV